MAQIQIDDNVKKEAEQIARDMGYKIVLGSKGEFGSKFIPDAVRAFKVYKDALEGIAAGVCCQTPGCSVDDPMCDVMIAKAALVECKNGREQS